MSFDNINNFAKKFWIFSYIRTECKSQILPSSDNLLLNNIRFNLNFLQPCPWPCPRPSPNAPLAAPWTGPELLDAGPSLGTPSATPIAFTLDEVPPANIRLQKGSFLQLFVTAGGAVKPLPWAKWE